MTDSTEWKIPDGPYLEPPPGLRPVWGPWTPITVTEVEIGGQRYRLVPVVNDPNTAVPPLRRDPDVRR